MEFGRFFYCTSQLVLCSVLVIPLMVGSIGINYGQIGNNLPSPDQVVPLIKSIGATKVKLYDANPAILKAFANTGIEFIVGLGNGDMSRVQDPNEAQNWVKTNVQAFLPSTKITSITVGNEVLTLNDTTLSNNLLPAMQSVHNALVTLGLDKQVVVTTPHSLAVLQTSYPPSSGQFRQDLVPVITQILNFQSKIGSPFLINAYPYFAYKGNPKEVSLDYVLFQPNPGMVDPVMNLKYDNMLFAQIDSVYAALASLGFKKIQVQISETGWPSKGDQDEAGASLENARRYNGNLMKTVAQARGTPMRPDSELDIFVFALFNENMKDGPTSERNYGLFKPDGTPAYPLGVTSATSVGTGGSGNGNGGGGSFGPDPQSVQDGAATGYLAFSSAEERCHSFGFGFILFILLIKWGALRFFN